MFNKFQKSLKNIWSPIVVFSRTHNDVKALSWKNRPDLRNNQGMEQSHNVTIKLGDASINSTNGSWERWINV